MELETLLFARCDHVQMRHDVNTPLFLLLLSFLSLCLCLSLSLSLPHLCRCTHTHTHSHTHTHTHTHKVAETVKGWIGEFQPFVPLIQALRNPGMRDRHWDQLSEKLGFTVKPDASFTFTTCLEKNLQNHIDAIVKVGCRS